MSGCHVDGHRVKLRVPWSKARLPCVGVCDSDVEGVNRAFGESRGILQAKDGGSDSRVITDTWRKRQLQSRNCGT